LGSHQAVLITAAAASACVPGSSHLVQVLDPDAVAKPIAARAISAV
jgi:hypothetical protein